MHFLYMCQKVSPILPCCQCVMSKEAIYRTQAELHAAASYFQVPFLCLTSQMRQEGRAGSRNTPVNSTRLNFTGTQVPPAFHYLLHTFDEKFFFRGLTLIVLYPKKDVKPLCHGLGFRERKKTGGSLNKSQE